MSTNIEKMESIKNFNDLIAHLANSGQRKKVAVVCASDDSTQGAVFMALEANIIDAVFVGCSPQIESTEGAAKYAQHISYVDADDPDDAAAKAVALVREGKADILMKGMINTDNLLKAVLNKETGILPKGRVLTHVTVAQMAQYHKLLIFSDAAVIPYPTQEQRVEQVKYTVSLCHALGITSPKVALIHCSEKVSEKAFPFTVGYKDIIDMAQQGAFGDCVVDGPLDLKTSLDQHSLEKKGIQSPLNGEADVLIFPDIEAGNVFYKTITFLAGADTAGILQGPLAPVVLASRGDSKESKFYSLAAAASIA